MNLARQTPSDFDETHLGARELHAAGAVIEPAGWPAPALRLVTRGWVACTRDWADGRRQILRLVLPGELLTTRLTAGPALCSAIALTPADVTVIAPQEAASPKVGALRLQAARRYETDLVSTAVRLGRLTAVERFAHLILDLAGRLDGEVAGSALRINWPITQEAISDVLGLSAVHINRTLQSMRAERLIEVRPGRLTILDRGRLEMLANGSAGKA